MPMYLRRIVDATCLVLACWFGSWLKQDAGYGWVATVLIASIGFIFFVWVLSRTLALIILLRLKILMWVLGITEADIKKPRH